MIDYQKEFEKEIVVRNSDGGSKTFKPTIIKINGVLYKTWGGKSIWKTPGYAKAALRCDLFDWLNIFINKKELTFNDKERVMNQLIGAAKFISLDIPSEIAEHVKY